MVVEFVNENLTRFICVCSRSILDSVMGNEIMEILQTLVSDFDTTITMVTHDEKIARQTNRIIRLFDGAQVN